MGDYLKLWVASLAGRMRREDGQAAVEYGVLLALILVLSIALIATVGEEIQAAFQAIVDEL